MEREAAMVVAKRMLSFVDGHTTEQDADVMTIPIADYLDADRWQREVDLLFRRLPLIMVASSQVREPGQYLARELLGLPLVTIRGSDGVARTFLNVCRHRGAEVCPGGEGSARRLTCPYHAWSYDTTGALVGVPGRDTFGDLDPAALGLTALPTQERHGLVWSVLTPGAPIDVDEWLGEMGGELASLRLGDTFPIASTTLQGPSWKVAEDGYFDGYHFGSLHRTTLGTIYRSNTQAVDTFGPHQRLCFATHDITELRDQPEDDWEPLRHLGLVDAVFPNTAFAGGHNGYLMSQVFPGPHPMTSTTYQTHLATQEPVTAEEREAAMERVRFLEYVVTEEDYRTGLGINRGLTSGANDVFVFGRNETGNQHFHRWVARLLDGDGR